MSCISVARESHHKREGIDVSAVNMKRQQKQTNKKNYIEDVMFKKTLSKTVQCSPNSFYLHKLIPFEWNSSFCGGEKVKGNKEGTLHL